MTEKAASFIYADGLEFLVEAQVRGFLGLKKRSTSGA